MKHGANKETGFKIQDSLTSCILASPLKAYTKTRTSGVDYSRDPRLSLDTGGLPVKGFYTKIKLDIIIPAYRKCPAL